MINSAVAKMNPNNTGISVDELTNEGVEVLSCFVSLTLPAKKNSSHYKIGVKFNNNLYSSFELKIIEKKER